MCCIQSGVGQLATQTSPSSQEVPQGWTEYQPPALLPAWPDTGKNVAMKTFDHFERSILGFGSIGKGRWYVFRRDGQAGGGGLSGCTGQVGLDHEFTLGFWTGAASRV